MFSVSEYHMSTQCKPNRPSGSKALTLRRSLFLAVAMLGSSGIGQAADPERSSAVAEAQGTAEQIEFFENKIRPVLVEHCYECHSAAAAAQGKLRGELMLDSRQATRKGGESGPAVVPGNSDESLVLASLRYETFEMPPQGKLPPHVIADFEKWVQSGAADPREGEMIARTQSIDFEAGKQFWSFQPLASTALPAPVGDESHAPIDRFIADQQQAAGLVMSPQASPRVLIRRAWLDLLGVPPTPQEMNQWLLRLEKNAAGTSTVDPAAWSDLITYLLDRPEYGERWARHWMDVARFAESYGYEQDYDRPHAYHYRDFLIRAFNDDLPYDQFVQWQIAGDELEPSNPQAWMATGFLSAGAFPTQLTEAEFETTRYDELDDMVSTTSLAFLGLSIGCARCHDHKFDPISAADYYQMAAIFTSAIRCETAFDLDPEKSHLARQAYEAKLQAERANLKRFESDQLSDLFSDWLKSDAPDSVTEQRWEILGGKLTSTGGSTFRKLDDGSFLAVGEAPAKEVLTFDTDPINSQLASFRIEALADASLPRQGPGRAHNGNFALGDLQVQWLDEQGIAHPIALAAAKATHQQNQDSLSIAASIDADPVSGWAIDGQIGQGQAGVFYFHKPLANDGPRRLRVTLTFNHPNGRHAMGRMRFSVSKDSAAVPELGEIGQPLTLVAAIQRLRVAFKQSPQSTELRNQSDWQLGLEWFKSNEPQWVALRQKIDELEKSGPPVMMTKIQVTSEGLDHLPHHANDRGYPHHYPETYVLRRGDVAHRIEVAQPTVPQVLRRGSDDWDTLSSSRLQQSNPKSSYRRAALAQWLTNPEQGAGSLAARVIVNRLWQHHFGQGIVATANDFGSTGQRPTHPELLDWLAGQLIENDWRLKPMHHQMMTSSAYMQGNRQRDDARQGIDPENTLLWHRAPRRLEGEAIRDSMLAVSGLLDTRMFGPGTLDANMRRRSVYFFIKRSQLIPSMMLFDWPEHLVSIGRRQSTTVAPQALMFMNHLQSRACADALAQQAVPLAPELAVEQIYNTVLARSATARELTAAIEFIRQNRLRREQQGEQTAAKSALSDFCQTMFSLNEFIYVD